MFRRLKRNAIFLAGNIRRERCLGGLAWGRYDAERLITYEEAEIARAQVQFGYIGLHRNRGDLSNIAIQGFMKHAWLHLNDHQIVEAVSEGVLQRHSFHPIMSDYVIILKPLLNSRIDKKARTEACRRAIQMVKLEMPYDDSFKFDLENEEKIFQDKEIALANMRHFGLGVSCTEMVALCYVGQRRKLGIYRTQLGKRQVIMPDSFISTHFRIVYASPSCVPEIASKFGLHEEGVRMLEEYWNKQNLNSRRIGGKVNGAKF